MKSSADSRIRPSRSPLDYHCDYDRNYDCDFDENDDVKMIIMISDEAQ